MLWSRTGCQHSGMVTPSSLLISFRSVRRMCRAFLMSNAVLFFAQSNMLVSSHSIGCCCPQVCSAMTDFSVSPGLVAALCSLMRVSKVLFVSLIYVYMAATARDLVHNSRLLLNISQPRESLKECLNSFYSNTKQELSKHEVCKA